MSRIVAVIGASRGIGKEFVRQLSQTRDVQVISSTRSPTSSNDSGAPNIKSIILDITADASVEEAAKEILELDTLIINAAMGEPDLLLSTSSEYLMSYFNTNVVGPHRVIQAFLPALLARKTRQIILVSSTSGSLHIQSKNRSRFQGPYAVSKAALNMLATQYDNELAKQDFTVIPISPGWVATDMGNVAGSGGMPVETSVRGMLKVIAGLMVEDSAQFLSFDGKTIPW